MVSHKRLLMVFGLLFLGLTILSATHAFGDTRRTMYLTFNRPVGLPGVSLASGTYVFELADPIGAWSIVRVMSRNRSQVYFAGFTYSIDRPAGMPRNQLVSFAEARHDAAQPITAWWPLDTSSGQQFIYHGK